VFPGPLFRDQLVEKGLEVSEHCRVSVFLNHEARRGVLKKRLTNAAVETAPTHDFGDSPGDVHETATRGGDGNDFLMHEHGRLYSSVELFRDARASGVEYANTQIRGEARGGLAAGFLITATVGTQWVA